ncbi:FtsX-like permease family protein [Nocardioides agariphilus]|jgi:putative ABC transport system permease protein|uniref:FtsX-like permease family protein n=1 Tax=Nocardioides agariphilus TaxID=433664 RepID=A0A930YHN8_9ACTN|nr:FtsX-like permease family protein [Nocardioides agariphilus]MBF4767203.1 FtsX-like permease family protein [Nocardioides agariphilus]
MLRLSIRNLLAGKLRLFLTVAAVTVGVSFVSGTFVLSDTMAKAFDGLYVGLTSGTDVVVKSKAAFEADVTTNGGQVRPIDEAMVDEVRGVPGVALARGGVTGFALILDRHGKPIQPGGAPTIGASVGDIRLAGDFVYRQGDQPTRSDQVAIDARTAEQAGFRLGDRVDVIFQGGRQTFTLVGIIGFGETDSLLGATMAGFDLTTAQRVLDKVGLVDEVDVQAEPGVSPAQLRDRIAAILPDHVEALTGDQVAADGSAAVRDAMGVFTTVLLVFAGISVLVGSFVIWNTFNVLVAQRRREVALLRAVGATRRQVLGGVLLEALLVGSFSGALGLVLGVALAAGIRSLLTLIGVEMPTTTPAVEMRTIVAALLVGIVVTMVAAVAPAWAATRVSPMEALRDAVPTRYAVGRMRSVAGWVLLAAGTAALVVCIVAGNQRWWTVLATSVTFAGLVVAGPTLARATARLADHGRRGGGWRLAARNIARNARRSAATALALTIGLTVVVAVAVCAASLRESVADAVSGGNRSDLILEPAGAGLGVSPSVADLLRRRDDVADVVELRETGARVNGHDSLVSAMSAEGLDRVIDLGVEEGSLQAFGPGGILVSTQEADDLGVGPGDVVTVMFPETGPTTLRVAATFSRGALINASYVLALPDFAANVTSELDAAILVDAAPGVDPAQAKTDIEAALAAYPNVTVNSPEDITAKAQASVNQLLGIVTALLLLAVVVAVLGIVNTLVLSVVERTRELGLLRAVGGTRRQVRSVVRRESILMSLLGAVTGVALGTLAGVSLSRALVAEGITTVSVPVVTLAIYLVVAAAVGVLAAVGPARRASRVDFLGAIASE